jgi:hypothetical protein
MVPMRYILVLGLIGASAYGLLQALRLEPSDSLPKLFDDSHNVQQFINLWSSNYTDDSLFACPSCLRASSGMDLGSIDAAGADVGSAAAGAGLLAGSNSTNSTGAAALSPAQSAAALGLTSPLDDIHVDEQKLKKKRVNKNTANVFILWGVRGASGNMKEDTSGTASPLKLDFDPKFDLGDVTQQRIVMKQVRGSAHYKVKISTCIA